MFGLNCNTLWVQQYTPPPAPTHSSPSSPRPWRLHLPVARYLQGVADYRDILRPHAGEDSSALVSDFRAKISAVRQREDAERSKGLGGLVRQIAPAVGGGGAATGIGGMLTSKDIVGDAPDTLSPGMAAAAAVGATGAPGGGGGPKPLAAKKKGGLWKSLDEGTREREEDFMRRNEAFQRVMEKRMAKEKAKREEQEAQQQ